jgi:hypothetical protein
MSSAGQTAYRITFEISPIMLTNGIAAFMPGGMLPIISLTQSVDFITGVLSGGGPTDLDNYFAHFNPLPGTSLIANKLATFPFANQATAANAIITQPLPVSMMMIVPAAGDGGYAIKLATMLALAATLKAHTNQGGTFIVATPSYFFTNCVLLDMRDVSSSESKQPQYRWQLDFSQPLISLQDASSVQNNAMSKITAGLPTDGSLTGLSQTINVPQSLAGLSVVPAASGLGAAGTAPLIPVTSSPLPALAGS